MNIDTPKRLLERMQDLEDGESKAIVTTLITPMYGLSESPNKFTPLPLAEPQFGFLASLKGYVLSPRTAETSKESSDARDFFANGKRVCDANGENIFVHPGETTRHMFMHNWSDSRKNIFALLLQWSQNNWLHLSKLVPFEFKGGVSFKAFKGIWFDFLIRIAKQDVLINIDEPLTMIGESKTITRSALEIFQSGQPYFGSLAPLPEGFVAETWFIENKYVWDNSIFALQWLLRTSEKQGNSSGPSSRTKGRTRGPKPNRNLKADRKLCCDWKAAKNHGQTRKQFCESKKIAIKDLDNAMRNVNRQSDSA